MASDGLFQFDAVEQIALLDRDAILEWVKPIRQTNKCGHGMSAFNRLSNDLLSGPSCSSKHKQLHNFLLPDRSWSGSVQSRPAAEIKVFRVSSIWRISLPLPAPFPA